jgi:hypothetical protein
MLKVGQRVRNVRRPDVIGVVTSLDAPNNQWAVRPQDLRVMVKYPRLVKLSNGKWKGGELDELPVDLLPTGEKVHEAFNSYKRSGDEGGVGARIAAYDRSKRRRRL